LGDDGGLPNATVRVGGNNNNNKQGRADDLNKSMATSFGKQ